MGIGRRPVFVPVFFSEHTEQFPAGKGEAGFMHEIEKQRNTLLSKKIIEGLKSRNMTGYFAETKEEALAKALELIPKGSSVTMGGAMSAHEIGLVDALKNGDYKFMRISVRRCLPPTMRISSFPPPTP